MGWFEDYLLRLSILCGFVASVMGLYLGRFDMVSAAACLIVLARLERIRYLLDGPQ